MTLIEFFDISPLQNISGVLNFPVNTVYFVDSNYRKMSSRQAVYEKVFSSRGKNVQIKYLTVPKYDMAYAVEKISEIINTDKDVIIDVSGGCDYLLAAAGIVAERYSGKGVQLQHLSLRSDKFVCFGDVIHKPQKTERINLTCDEIIELHGGKITYANRKKSGTVKWNFEHEDFAGDVEKMWALCRKDCRNWNRLATRLGELENMALNVEYERGYVRLDVSVQKKRLLNSNKFQFLKDLEAHLDNLEKEGLIKEYRNDRDVLSFVFKNEQVRQCLLKAGNVLELVTYLAAVKAENRKGQKVYCDALSGVVLDWDGEINGKIDTENEIDGLFIRGAVPVFVSCKNGHVDENELYKLSSVANKFGVKYGKRVLVATDLQKNESSLRYFKKRAQEMNVTIIDGVHRMTFRELCRRIATV